MADSNYYYQMYKQKRDEAKRHEKNKKALEKIRDSLTDKMYDEIRNINTQIDQLMEDLQDGVRYNSTFTNRARGFGSQKEKAVTADSALSVTVNELEEEISSLSSKQNQAEISRDDYYNKYKAKKDEERQEFWDSIF